MLEGVIVFQHTNIGSKSEGLRPFLYTGNGQYMQVWKNGDISFIGSDLLPYDSNRVEIEGEMNEYDIFCISSIKIIETKETN